MPKGSGETTEIDLIYITQKGIFVFESKNYSGWIFGDEASNYWTASLPNGQKNRFYNPVKQNAAHLKWLRTVVGESIPLFSIVVFSERCELKKVTVSSNTVWVIKRDHTYATVRKIWDQSPDVLDIALIDRIYEQLSEMRQMDQSVKQRHIENIKRKYKTPQSKAATYPASSANVPTGTDGGRICPRCGAALVLRTAKKGTNAGKQFYGCSAFPKCRYTEQIG